MEEEEREKEEKKLTDRDFCDGLRLRDPRGGMDWWGRDDVLPVGGLNSLRR
jgi:hypothetical protein